MPVRKRFCEASAAELLAGAGVAEAPVDVEGLAESLLLKVARIPGWKHHARALLEHGEIRVNASESPEAQRFSIGHELGHHSIHPDGFVFSAHEDPESDLYAEDPDAELEREAEYFSSVLLVPPKWLRRDVGNGMTLAVLERRYRVSRAALFSALGQHRLLNRVRE